MWNAVFSIVSIVAVIAWAILILMPRGPVALSAVMYLGVGLLCLVYAVGVSAVVTGAVDPAGPAASFPDFGTIAGVRALFVSDAGVVLGWTHYLALDLFAGLWIARDADAKGFSR